MSEAELIAIGDPRPVKALRAERALAFERGGFGVLAALLAAGDFGLVVLDGGHFGLPSEWATVRASRGVTWVVLVDTHERTLAVLLHAHKLTAEWEVKEVAVHALHAPLMQACSMHPCRGF